MHDGQRLFWERLCAGVPRLVLQANRRAGKSWGGGLACGERMISQDGYVVRCLTTHLEGPSEAWIEREGDRGFVGLLDELGVPYKVTRIGGAARGIKALRFPWGSSLVVHDLANVRAIGRKRGFAGNVFWADEAQELEHLAVIMDELVTAASADKAATRVLTGTPGREVGTLFHRAATGEDPAWERHAFYCWDNPLFGAEPGERWRGYLTRMGLDGDRVRLGVDDASWAGLVNASPAELRRLASGEADTLPLLKSLPTDWQKEHLGRWVEEAADFVYPITGLPHEVVYWANDGSGSPRDRLPGLPTLGSLSERIAALPADELRPGQWVKRKWSAVAGFDLGMSPDPFAWWVGAYCEEEPGVWEILSGAENGLMDSQMLDKVTAILDELKEQGLYVAAALVDASGDRKGTGAEWSWRLRARFGADWAGILAPDKQGKRIQVKAINVDVQRGLLKALRGSRADIEVRHLRYKPFDPAMPKEPEIDKYRRVYLADGTELRPGDHCADARRYSIWWLHHHGHEWKPKVAPVVELEPARQIAAMHAAMRRGMG